MASGDVNDDSVADELDAVAIAVDEHRTRGAIYCRHCDYNLRGLTSRRCPECGAFFDWNRPQTYELQPQPVRRRRLMRRLLLGMLSLLALAAALVWQGLFLLIMSGLLVALLIGSAVVLTVEPWRRRTRATHRRS